MDIKEAIRMLEAKRRLIEKTCKDTIPRKIGVKAVNLTNQNFREGGFNDGGLKPWKRTRRQDDSFYGKKATSKYGPLLSARNHLSRSNEYEVQVDGTKVRVILSNPVSYAAIHNKGGIVESNPRVTPKMRKYFWARYYHLAGIKKKTGKKARKQKEENLPEEALKYKRLALTRKSTLKVKAKIPQRQFIGQSKELDEIVRTTVINELEKIWEK